MKIEIVEEINPGYRKDIGFMLERLFENLIGLDTTGMLMIDMCCANASITRRMTFKESVYVDVRPGAMEDPLPGFVCVDVLADHEIFDRKYDVSFCVDGIEHLSKEDGFRLIERMEKISKHVLIFTPLGDYCVGEGDDPLGHHSGWSPEDFEDYTVVSIHKFHEEIKAGALVAYRNMNISADDDYNRVVTNLNYMRISNETF